MKFHIPSRSKNFFFETNNNGANCKKKTSKEIAVYYIHFIHLLGFEPLNFTKNSG